MVDVINLNRFRKARAKAERGREADANRVKFGRSAANKVRDEADAARRKALLDGAKRED